jgi:O-antigen/teichoic acid export membrane protein
VIRLSDKLQLIGSAYFQQVIRIGTLFVMARFIGPQDKGIYMTLVYAAGLVMALNDFAIPQGVVQIREEPENVVVDTGLVLNGLLYSFYGLFAIAAGFFLTRRDANHNPQYWRIGLIFATTNFLTSLYNVQLARLNRRLEFRAESRQNLIFALSTGVTGIIFAVLHYGAYALALQLLAGQLAANVAINLRVPLSWPRQVSWRVARRFLTLGAPASIATYIRAVEAPVIGLIITPISGAIGLGLWSQAIQVQQMFGQNLLASFQRVAYPMVCQSVSDEERIRKLFARITLMLMMISLWFTVVVGINSEAIVRICLGRSWMSAAPLLRITAWAIPAGALDMVANIMCMALGISKSFIRSAVLNLVLFIPAALIVRQLGGGLVGLATCWSVSRYLIALTTIDAVQRKIRFGLRDIARPLAALFGAGVAACAAMIAIRLPLGQLRLPIQFAIIGFIGSIVYMAGVWFLEPSTVRDAMNMARGRAAGENPQPLEETLVGTTENPAGEQGDLWASSQRRTEPSN